MNHKYFSKTLKKSANPVQLDNQKTNTFTFTYTFYFYRYIPFVRTGYHF